MQTPPVHPLVQHVQLVITVLQHHQNQSYVQQESIQLLVPLYVQTVVREHLVPQIVHVVRHAMQDTSVVILLLDQSNVLVDIIV